MIMNPLSFELEQTSVWSFPERGSWATHNGSYRGNWSPYVPRNIILRYSREGDWILDQFLGSGTTLVEAKLLNRNAIGIDVNKDALALSRKNLAFNSDSTSRIELRLGSATNLKFIKDNSIDLICCHPPYANIIRYSENIPDDLSLLSYDFFLESIRIVASEAHRVLKAGKICAFMMGDIRQNGNTKPLGFESMNAFCSAGFSLKEIIVKTQHNCRSTQLWENTAKSFLLLAHEYIFILRKNATPI